MIDGFNMEEAKAKLAEAIDPNNTYTYDEFLKEYDGSKQELTEITKISVGFTNESDNQDPDWETSGSSGFDIRANEYGSIAPQQFKTIPTGLYFDIPENFEIQIRPRSGLAAKHGVTVLNTPGTIDSDYTGEIKIILINHSDKKFDVSVGDRIAQGVISTVLAKNIIELRKLDMIDKDTNRGSGGFGSTGIK